MTDLLTADEVAERLRVSPRTIRAWTLEGLIPAIRITGKVIRYDLEAVLKAVRTNATQRSQAEGEADE